MKKHNDPRVLTLLASMMLLTRISAAHAGDYFDPGLLTLMGAQPADIDLSAFSQSGQTPPGRYLVSLYINQVDQGQYTINFVADERGNVQPALTPALLQEIGVNTEGVPALADLPEDEPVPPLPELIEHARTEFDLSRLRLDLSVPQIAMRPDARGAINPELWDHGVPAALLNYSLNGGRNWQFGQSGTGNSEQTNLFASLRGGINLGPWRLRGDMAWTRNTRQQDGQPDDTTQQTTFSNRYLMRDIAPLRSSLIAGETSTAGDVLDSVPFRGVKLNSTDEMLPYSLRGFAPVVEGIAQSNARVTISQNGNVIYQTYVAPGPFIIRDLNQTGQGGDLTITVTEADGTVHTQTQAISSLPVMRRPGSLKYELNAGRYNGGITVGSREAKFISGTATYGLPYDMTLYGGALLAGDYRSMVAGVGSSLGSLGALSADITTSRMQLAPDQGQLKGRSYRVRYAKSMLSTGTSVDLAAYRYSTENYYSFADFNNMGYQLNDDQAPWALSRQRSSVQLRMDQQLNTFGSLFVSASRQDFWGKNQILNTVSAGYNGNYRGISFGLAYSIDRTKGDGNWPENKQLSLNVQVPLSLFSPAAALHSTYASYQVAHNNQGQVQHLAGINGSMADNRLSYSAMQGWSNVPQSNDMSTLNAGYQGSKGNLNAGYSYSDRSRSVNLSGNGSIVAHPEGITLSQTLGDSVAIVSAPGSEGTSLMHGNIRTDSRGYAVMPYLANYQGNNVGLNPSTLPDDVDLAHSNVTVYPTKGAVVMAKFATKVGYQAMITLTQKNGAPVPFGAIAVLDTDSKTDQNSSIIGDAGLVYMSGLPEKGTLSVKWGQDTTRQCRIRYDLKAIAAPSASNPVRSLTARCQ